ncbi:hypothetical protein BEWA_036510 [Theileria equi strain WA]|uniref:Uncharacterized protein n=1 Tax=Theileria equi strain WA TaxID=1537102 RepID=L1LED4_THEEQ|nr:hypothetical protein BEWA_036510 [Theileria equi strain WA]EKX73615.1 hypothetical protein BEWA_036510 [Theileria equi strain WA]|eukprot:XP_004833067.1 hypothetical protein BEWA_036510 [Theileria equi strain WA]
MAVFAFNTTNTAACGFSYESEDTLLTFFGIYVTPIVYSLFNSASKYPLFPDDSVNISVDEFLHSDLGLSTTIDLWDVVLMFSHLIKCKKDLLSGLVSRNFVVTFLIMSLVNIFLLGLTFPTAEGDAQQFFDISTNFMRNRGNHIRNPSKSETVKSDDYKVTSKIGAPSSFDVDKRGNVGPSGNVDMNPFRSSLDMFTIAKYAFVIGFFLIDLPYLCYRIYLLSHSNGFSLLLYKNVLFLFLRPYRLNMNQLAERDTAKGWQTAFFEAESTNLKMDAEISADVNEGEYLKKFTRRYTMKQRQSMRRSSTFSGRMSSINGLIHSNQVDSKDDGPRHSQLDKVEDSHIHPLDRMASADQRSSAQKHSIFQNTPFLRSYTHSNFLGNITEDHKFARSGETGVGTSGPMDAAINGAFRAESADRLTPLSSARDIYSHDTDSEDEEFDNCNSEDALGSIDMCKTFILKILRKNQKLPVKSFPIALVVEYCKKFWQKAGNSTKRYGISSMENVHASGYTKTILYRYYSSIFFTIFPRIFIVVLIFSYTGDIRPPRLLIGDKLENAHFVEMLPYYAMMISSFMIPFSFYSTCGILDLVFLFIRETFNLLSLITCVCAFKSSLPKGYEVIHGFTSIIFLVYPIVIMLDLYWSVYRYKDERRSEEPTEEWPTEKTRVFLYRLEFFICKYSISPIAINFKLLSTDLMECIITMDILIHSQWSYLIYTCIFRLLCCSITSSKVSITIVLIDLLLGLTYTTLSQSLRALILRGQEIAHIIATSQDKTNNGNVSLGEVDKYIKVQGLLSSPGIIVPAFL